jgi:hypothetical protein
LSRLIELGMIWLDARPPDESSELITTTKIGKIENRISAHAKT